MITTGTRLRSTVMGGSPATRPPTKQPMGSTMNPARTPTAKNRLSSFSMIPQAVGMEKEMTPPMAEATISPPK